MNNLDSSTDSDSGNEIYNISNNNSRNSVVNNSRISDSENRNINISDRKNSSIVTNIVVNMSIGDNRVNLSNFLNNEIYVMWYQLYDILFEVDYY